MKRWMGLSVAAMLLFAWSRSEADYLIIKVDVNRNYFAPPAPQGKGPAGGAGGNRLNAFQPPGPGPGGPGSIYGPPGGGMYGKGFPGFPQGGGAAGQFPGYNPGQFPGKGMYGGGQYMGGMGKPPDFPNMGGKDKGKIPNPKGSFEGPPKGFPGARDETQPRWVYAYLELTSKPRVYSAPKTGPTHLEIDHPWGRKCIVPLELVKLPYDEEKTGYIYKESMPLEYDKRLKKWVKDGKDPVRLMNLAVWALEHGLLKDFHKTVDIMEKEKADARPEKMKALLKSYARVREALAKPPAGDDPALAGLLTDLKKAGYRQLNSSQGHYSAFTNVDSARNAGIMRRLALMEDAYEKFYYWFGLHNLDTMPPVPQRRLVAIIVNDRKEFAEKQKAWGSLPLVGDGFLPRRDNVMVLSAEHLDENFILLKKNNQEMVKQRSRESLLSGSVWPEGKYKMIAGKLAPSERARFLIDKKIWDEAGTISYQQTLVLVEKILATEAERATISHEATRQLLFATGMLPRNVEVPEWIQYGLASFFETPQGSFYPSVGLPSWTNLIDFKYHRKKHLGAAKDVLLNMVSDRYFLKARESEKILNASRYRPEHLASKAKDDEEIARSTAWAMVYFLAKEGKLSALLKYSEELDRLPRDLELSPRVLTAAFARAFNLPDARLQEIANEWFSAMENTVLEIQEWERDFLHFRLEGGNTANTGL
ncbi:MAG TPA: DUF1570 domain-containing protein [Gemmataceae bacterium]|nr:DUF1570 domain-containing protein [Gemmataceae bacterium]